MKTPALIGKIIVLASAFATSQCVLATPVVSTVRCNLNNLCATGVTDFEFQGTIYNVSFSRNFSEDYPDPTLYPLFWGRPDLAASAAFALASVLESAGVQLFSVGTDGGATTGIFFAVSASQTVSGHGNGALIVYGGYYETGPIFQAVVADSFYLQAIAPHAVFTPVSQVPEPSPGIIFPLLLLVLFRLHRTNSRTMAGRDDAEKQSV